MATVKQIEANRRNATRSTGPATAVGKSKSSRNALRHGLSLPLIMNAATMANVEELARLLANEDTNNMSAALHAAAAHLDLQRVQKIRRDMLAKMDLATATPKDLQRLLAIDRYETRARTRRRRASSRIAVEEDN
jgi:nitrate reductase beta subunit